MNQFSRPGLGNGFLVQFGLESKDFGTCNQVFQLSVEEFVIAGGSKKYGSLFRGMFAGYDELFVEVELVGRSNGKDRVVRIRAEQGMCRQVTRKIRLRILIL